MGSHGMPWDSTSNKSFPILTKYINPFILLSRMSGISDDTSSLLQQLQNLEAEKKRLDEEKKKIEEQNRILEEKNRQNTEILNKVNEEKRIKMLHDYNTVVAEYIKTLDLKDEKAKQDLVLGIESTINKSHSESPIWQLMCCASQQHKRNVNELQRITEEYNQLKTKVEGGAFQQPEARLQGNSSAHMYAGTKRPEPESSSGSSYAKPTNYWDEFEKDIRSGGLASFVPDQEKIRELRREWTPVNVA